MAKVTTESVYRTKTPKKDTATPIANAFGKLRNVKPLLSNELLRKRRRVKRS